MRRNSAEGRTCEICGRRMLAGETYDLMDHAGRRVYRRSVCVLCRKRAEHGGWSPSPQLPPRPDVVPPQEDETPPEG